VGLHDDDLPPQFVGKQVLRNHGVDPRTISTSCVTRKLTAVRAWKVRLILGDNPNLDDFYERLV
jgi:hypothetical protein